VLVVQRGQVAQSGGAVARNVVNCFAYRSPNPSNPPSFGPFFNSYKANVGDRICDRLSTDYTSVELSLWLKCNTLGINLNAGFTCQNGQIAGDRLPLSLAVNHILRTGLRGRNYTGLKRYGPIPAASVVGDELAGFEVTAWHFVAGQVKSGFTSSDGWNWIPVVFSRQLSHRTLTTFIPWLEDVTAVDTNLTLGLARHRRERHP